MFGLTTKEVLLIQDVFKNQSTIDEVFIFGSRAMKSHRSNSDIDFCIKGRTFSFSHLLSLKVKIEELALPYFIDIVNYKMVDIELKHQIDTKGKLFYSTTKTVDFD